jgi:hypothetical protein
MCQYTPLGRNSKYPALARPLESHEYQNAVDLTRELGFENLWLQEPASVSHLVPDFTLDQPFS